MSSPGGLPDIEHSAEIQGETAAADAPEPLALGHVGPAPTTASVATESGERA